MLWAYRIADKYLKRGDCKKRLSDRTVREVDYRKQREYRSILHEDSSNERYLQTASLLKKYTTSALYLATSTEREGTTLEQFALAVAAGISMVFATVVAFYSQARYGVMSFPVFLALVVGYMFKDRIKETGRGLSERLVRNMRYDQRTTLYTPDEKEKIGNMREKMTFVEHGSLPAEVLAERARQGDYLSGLEDQYEEIICYAKEVNFKRSASRLLDLGGADITGIRDIMRYDIRRYLRKTADPVEQRYTIVDGELVAVDCHKTYQLEFVTEYGSGKEGEPLRYHHTVIHLDRDGITGTRARRLTNGAGSSAERRRRAACRHSA